MARIRVRTIIEADRRTVWRAIEDVGSHVDWMHDAVAIRFTSAQSAGPGTTFDCDTRVGPFRLTDRMEITEWVPGRRMGVRHLGLVAGDGAFRLGRAGRGRTRFEWRERLTFPWWMGGPVGAMLAKPVLRRIWARNLAALKQRIEG